MAAAAGQDRKSIGSQTRCWRRSKSGMVAAAHGLEWGRARIDDEGERQGKRSRFFVKK
jgi:hypothetical protein